jgi:putative ABC transport system ATP-binding protein
MDPRKILVVDRDKDTAHYVCSYLEESGYDTLQVNDGETALHAIRLEKPDLVVLDWAASDKDGLEIMRAIRADPHFFRLPIIILSARTSETDKGLGLDMGADDYVAKPFNPRELAARVGAVLRRYQRQKAKTKAPTSCEREEEKAMDADQQNGNGALIEIENLTKVYQMGEVQVHALCGVSLVVRQGEYVAIMGASGSGKSTLMNMIGLLDRPSSGSYRIKGLEAGKLNKGRLADLRNREIGFVFQQFNLLPRISARRQVELPLFYAGTGRGKAQARAQQVLVQVGLADRANHHPDELSGGEQQRVAIARALVNQPSLLLADEPTGALDTKTGSEVLDLIDELHAQGLTIVMVTHDPRVAQRAGRVITLSDGVIVSDQENGKKLVKMVMGVEHENT